MNSTPCNGEVPAFAFNSAPRCGAKTRTGTPCKSPAVNLKRRCRMHGGAQGSGAPKGNLNAYRHGCYTRLMKAERSIVSHAIKEFKELQKKACP